VHGSFAQASPSRGCGASAADVSSSSTSIAAGPRAPWPMPRGISAPFGIGGPLGMRALAGPGADVGESRRRCGRVPAQMWASPGADVGESRRRCGLGREQHAPRARTFALPQCAACCTLYCPVAGSAKVNLEPLGLRVVVGDTVPAMEARSSPFNGTRSARHKWHSTTQDAACSVQRATSTDAARNRHQAPFSRVDALRCDRARPVQSRVPE
jgi:hypothetical protein